MKTAVPSHKALFSPGHLGAMGLSNRIVMAPMTRSRADEAGIPCETTAAYYAQRATAGLIISEAINISEDAKGSALTPGLYSTDQVEVWQRITDAVHEADGKIFAQLWHTGRVAHSVVRGGVQPVAPSPIAIADQRHFTLEGMKDYETPRQLNAEEIHTIIRDYGIAADNALRAGFDGVELHGAFGYLPNQFLVSSSNTRSDTYGGSIENRCRFMLSVLRKLIDVAGATRVGVKLSPTIYFNSMVDEDPVALYAHLLAQINTLELAYVHLMEPLFPLDDFPSWPKSAIETFGPMIETQIVANGGFDAVKANAVIKSGQATAVSFGTDFVANPDLPHRIAHDIALAEPDKETMYGGGDAGYIDYPSAE